MRKHPDITDYDASDTSAMIDPHKPLGLADLGFKLPPVPPSQVVSIRLPTRLLNEIRARASAIDIPYQAFIKLCLSRALGHRAG